MAVIIVMPLPNVKVQAVLMQLLTSSIVLPPLVDKFHGAQTVSGLHILGVIAVDTQRLDP